MERARIAELVQQAVVTANLGRADGLKLSESADAAIFGPASPLDSLGLVALLIDIEDAFAAEGRAIVLSDDRAVSQRRSPYRDVPSLVHYIAELLSEPPS